MSTPVEFASLPKGNAREKWLNVPANRALMLNSGANITIYEGEIYPSENVIEALKNINIGLILRKRKDGRLDGLGAFGGLAERTSQQEFERMTTDEKIARATQKDDIIISQGTPLLTTNIDIIRKKNALRELREELDDLGIAGTQLNDSRLELIPMPKVKDDNFAINIWNGTGECFAINPYCHIYHDNSGILNKILQQAQASQTGEVASFKKMPLLDALGAYGHKGSDACLEDGRSATEDYRYPHEYLAAWGLASKLLEHRPECLVSLAKTVQSQNHHPISFKTLALKTGQDMEDIAQILKVSPETLSTMEKSMETVYQTKFLQLKNKSLGR